MTSMNKGRLTIFTSYTPGAGKSYLMMSEAQKRKQQGKNIAIGFVNEEHRSSSALSLNPDNHRNYSLKKLLLQRPHIVLLDEMGMSGKNVDKRSFVYEDIHELIENGIDVYTTTNLKRFEGVNPLFKQVTGIGIRKTIPDSFLDKAYKICFLDRSPELMLQDFLEGKFFDEKYSDSKVMKKNFNIDVLRQYRDISIHFLKEKYPQKTVFLERK